jgi:hypothetical protein
MKRISLAALLAPLLLLASPLALADFDERDAQEAKAFEAQNREAARKEAARKQKLEADRTKAEADMYRKALGARTNGKTDAEVIAMMKAEQAAALKQYGQPSQQAGKSPAGAMNEQQATEMMRKATGNPSLTMEDIAKMSDAEMEALARKAAKGK